jgi:ribose transport system substrate-binding protein
MKDDKFVRFMAVMLFLIMLLQLVGVGIDIANFIKAPPTPVVAQAPAAEKTVKELQAGKPFRYVTGGLEHPTIRLMILGFTEACKKYNADCQIMGYSGFEDSDYIRMVETSTAQGASGMVVATYGPYRPAEVEAIKQGITLVGFHTPMEEGDIPGLLAWVATDVKAYGKAAADAMADKLKCAGPIAVTQNTFNDVENVAASSFTDQMKVRCPDVVVFPPEIEGGDQAAAIAKAGAILTAHPDIAGAYGTTGGSPVTWGKALEQAGRKPGDVIVIGMDYSINNLDLIKSGWVYAVVGQPIFEETYKAVEILIAHLRGEPVQFDNVYPSPIITIENMDKYLKYNDLVIEALKDGIYNP